MDHLFYVLEAMCVCLVRSDRWGGADPGESAAMAPGQWPVARSSLCRWQPQYCVWGCSGDPSMHGAVSSEEDISMTKVSPRPSQTLPGCSSMWRTRWHHRLPRMTSRSRGVRRLLLAVLIPHHVGNLRICLSSKIFTYPSLTVNNCWVH